MKKLVLALLVTLFIEPLPADTGSDYYQSVQDYRQRRETGLQRPEGWLSLVGLHWLEPGANTVGAASSNDIVIPGGPELWGTVTLDGDRLSFEAAEGADVHIDNGPLRSAQMIPDTQGDPTVIRSDTISIHAIERGSYGLRVKDSQALTRLNFSGLDYYPIDSGWLLESDVELAGEGETIPIGNVLGQLEDSPKYATLSFTVDGQEYSLDALGSPGDEQLFIIFADRSNGRETYGAGRFLYTGMPENGKLMLDFNKAYNPPCAFNDYSTCPLPPPQNRLDLWVRAGELNYHSEAVTGASHPPPAGTSDR